MKYIRIEKIYNSFKKDEFIEYFSKIGHENSKGHYVGDGWQVMVGEEGIRQFKGFNLPSVKLSIIVREDIHDQFMRELMISFLKGGG